jgi:hypothetical protein
MKDKKIRKGFDGLLASALSLVVARWEQWLGCLKASWKLLYLGRSLMSHSIQDGGVVLLAVRVFVRHRVL